VAAHPRVQGYRLGVEGSEAQEGVAIAQVVEEAIEEVVQEVLVQEVQVEQVQAQLVQELQGQALQAQPWLPVLSGCLRASVTADPALTLRSGANIPAAAPSITSAPRLRRPAR